MKQKRIGYIDTIRGITMISMLAFHFTWDLIYMMGLKLSWLNPSFSYLWQQSICWSFILISGFCWSMSRKPLKNGCRTFLCGAMITVITMLFVPEAIVIFGILTFLGSAMLLLYPLDRFLQKIWGDWTYKKSHMDGIICFIAVAGCFLLFLFTKNVSQHFLGLSKYPIALPDWLYANDLTTFIGFPRKGFFSTDYFALIPWSFLYLTGYFFYHFYDICLREYDRFQLEIPFLSFIGKRCIWIYMIHQPVLYGLCVMLRYLKII